MLLYKKLLLMTSGTSLVFITELNFINALLVSVTTLSSHQLTGLPFLD